MNIVWPLPREGQPPRKIGSGIAGSSQNHRHSAAHTHLAHRLLDHYKEAQGAFEEMAKGEAQATDKE